MQPSCIVGNVVHQCIHEFMHYNAQCHKRGKMVRVSCIKYEPPDIVLLSLYIDAFNLPDKICLKSLNHMTILKFRNSNSP